MCACIAWSCNVSPVCVKAIAEQTILTRHETLSLSANLTLVPSLTSPLTMSPTLAFELNLTLILIKTASLFLVQFIRRAVSQAPTLTVGRCGLP